MNKRLKIRLNFHICKSSTVCEGITIFCIKIFSLSVNEVLFNLSLSRSFSIVSVLQKWATKLCCLGRRDQGETDKKYLSESLHIRQLCTVGRTLKGLQISGKQTSKQMESQPETTRVHCRVLGNWELRLAHYPGHMSHRYCWN